MRKHLFALVILSLHFTAVATPQNVSTTLSAQNPEVLASYAAAQEFVDGLSLLKPKIQSMCKSLLASQLRLQQTKDTWKLYSLYEMLDNQNLMTDELLRVPTVTELANALPQYTHYRVSSRPNALVDLKSGSILVADKGAQCGPDPYSVIKGAYFLKCGDFLIGSGLVRLADLQEANCLNLRTLKNQDLSR